MPPDLFFSASRPHSSPRPSALSADSVVSYGFAIFAPFAFNLFPSPSTRGSSSHFRLYSTAPAVNSTSASDSRYSRAASNSRK